MFELRRNGEAVVHLSAALYMGATGSRVRRLLALALLQVGERQGALAELRRALAEQPDDRDARLELQRALADPQAIEWPTTVALSRRMLVGKARAGFEDALALWGEPEPDKPLLDRITLRYAFRMFLPPSLIDRRSTMVDAGIACGRYVGLDAREADQLAVGERVRVAAVPGRWLTAPDQVIARVAATSRGVYSAWNHRRELTLRPVMVEGRRVDPESTLEVNLRRLERLAR